MSAPAALALVTGGLAFASEVKSGMADSQALDTQRKEYKINALQERYARDQAYQEGAMTVNQQYAKGEQDVAAGEAALAAAGNIGTSAQTAVGQGFFNLAKDISAINYKYGNEAIQHENKARNYSHNAWIVEKNRRNRILSSYISGTAKGVEAGLSGYSMAGGSFGAAV